MKKYFKLSIHLELKHYPDQTALNVRFDRSALHDWCLGLFLLQEGLVDSLVIAEEQGTQKLELQLLRMQVDTSRSLVHFGTKTIRLGISPSEFGYLVHFFLRYFRDGVAEVDHVDLQANSESGEEEENYITFIVPDYGPPLSEEEGRRRLGL